MDHQDTMPFEPWGDRDHPEAESDADARWKWGRQSTYVDGHTVAMADEDPRLEGRAFLKQPEDPYAYVDGVDVRDLDTGTVHPVFLAILEHLGVTDADISQSGAGVHAISRGELPTGVKQATWELDDTPWGSNEDCPSIEISAGKRVCVTTGDHVPGTPTEVHAWSDDTLEALLEATDQLPTVPSAVSTARDDYDLADYEPEATDGEEMTDDIWDIFAALGRLDACKVAANPSPPASDHRTTHC